MKLFTFCLGIALSQNDFYRTAQSQIDCVLLTLESYCKFDWLVHTTFKNDEKEDDDDVFSNRHAKHIQHYVLNCSVGDWFVLYQVSLDIMDAFSIMMIIVFLLDEQTDEQKVLLWVPGTCLN